MNSSSTCPKRTAHAKAITTPARVAIFEKSCVGRSAYAKRNVKPSRMKPTENLSATD